MTQTRVLLTGLGFGESPRWHDGRLWLSNWGTQEVLAVDADGKSEVKARIPTASASMPRARCGTPDVPDKRCVRVREGGEVLATVEVDRGCFACMLGGPDGRTLFIAAAEWRGMENMMSDDRTGQVLTTQAPAPHAGHP